MSNQLNPKIYVACLAAYNNGYDHGAWIDANQSAEEIHEEIQALLNSSPIANAEEWAIHDYEDFGGAKIGEFHSVESVAELAAFIIENGVLGAEVLGYVDNDIEEAKRMLEEGYRGEYDSEEDYAQELFESCYDIPEHLANYIDYQAVARDLFITDYFTIDIKHKKHVFSNYY